jgi:hypothetical protein
VLLDVSITFCRSAVFAILAMTLVTPQNLIPARNFRPQ